MIVAHVIDRDPAVRLAACRALQPAGFAVSAGTMKPKIIARPDLMIADLSLASRAALRRRHPSAKVLVLGDGGLPTPFTPSQLLAAVRRCLAQPCATTGRR